MTWSPFALLNSAHKIRNVVAIAFIWLFLVLSFQHYRPGPGGSILVANVPITNPSQKSQPNTPYLQSFGPIEVGARYLLDYPLTSPYKNVFGELGQRAVLLRSWIEELEASRRAPAGDDQDDRREAAATLVEQVAESLFPYLKPVSINPPFYSPPLTAIRDRVGLSTDPNNTAPIPQSVGIVIPTGDKTVRFACHLIASLIHVHKTKLPIQVVYAGPDDLSQEGRNALFQAAGGRDIDLLDILTVFDDVTLKLTQGGWAIKSFASLASRFEQVILADADAVFLQDPKELLQQDRYRETGVLLFHDRLLWKGGFPERQDWWHEQIKHPSAETKKSLVWTERYSEEGDSGLVVVDKSRLDVLLGLLHIGWQNSYEVREEWTYQVMYGDKETWWIGFEDTESTYAFSPHYSSIVGWLEPKKEKKEGETLQKGSGEYPAVMNTIEDDESKVEKKEEARVCSFVIAHVDQTDKLLWYNGGLLKNKVADQTSYEVPTHWMKDQEWIKGGSKQEMSCMIGTDIKTLSEGELEILSQSIAVAKEVDKRLGLILSAPHR